MVVSRWLSVERCWRLGGWGCGWGGGFFLRDDVFDVRALVILRTCFWWWAAGDCGITPHVSISYVRPRLASPHHHRCCLFFSSCVCRLSYLLLYRVCCTLWAPCGALSCSVPGWIFVSFQGVWLRLSIDERSHTSTRGYRQDDPALFSGAFLVWSALSLRLVHEVE